MMREDRDTNSEHDAGRFERFRVSDDWSRIDGTWWETADIPARSDVAGDE